MSGRTPLARFTWVMAAAVLLIPLLLLLVSFLPREAGIPITTLAERVEDGQVDSLTVQQDGTAVAVLYKGGGTDVVFKEVGISVFDLLAKAGVKPSQIPIVKVEPPRRWAGLTGIEGVALPLAMVAGLLVFMVVGGRHVLRQMQNTDSTGYSSVIGKSRAVRLVGFRGDRPRVGFDDVAGVDEAKEELCEVVDFLKTPARFTALGARVPKGVLLVGPPGTGKTLLAKAVAGEAWVPFFSMNGSEFVEVYVGLGAARVRELFDQAKRYAPCIVFVDEIDAVGRRRGAGPGGHDERDQALNQILVEMDGFETSTSVVVIAATNRPDVLDPALLRPGRFDRQVVLDPPDVNGRLSILRVHARTRRLVPEVDLADVARATSGFSGADLENLLNEAAILTARRNKSAVTMAEMSEAIDRVIAGPQRKSRLISEREKEVMAYHEMGHAIVASALEHADPVQKVSIVARGSLGGYTRLQPADDHCLWTRSQLLDSLSLALGGLAAEELVLGELSSGSANDIERVSELARRMVCEYGMSEKLGPIALGKREEQRFLGGDAAGRPNYGDALARQIDEEVQRLIREAHERARDILSERREQLAGCARLLVERETLEGEELRQALRAPQTTAAGAQLTGLRGRSGNPGVGGQGQTAPAPERVVPGERHVA